MSSPLPSRSVPFWVKKHPFGRRATTARHLIGKSVKKLAWGRHSRKTKAREPVQSKIVPTPLRFQYRTVHRRLALRDTRHSG
jgi:hypothetical protein